jgi:ribosomal protein S18 acetylase RimI-like enzyme
MEIRALSYLENHYNSGWGNNGYYTPKILDVKKSNVDGLVSFQLSEVNKICKKTYLEDFDTVARFNEIIKDGYSFGAFENDKLIGVVIGEYRQWNNTLNIVTILVSEHFRRNRIGEKLIEKIKQAGKNAGIRLIELETQNTNLPAVKFYLKQEFQITGLNLKLYQKESAQEVALFMSHELKSDDAG